MGLPARTLHIPFPLVICILLLLSGEPVLCLVVRLPVLLLMWLVSHWVWLLLLLLVILHACVILLLLLLDHVLLVHHLLVVVFLWRRLLLVECFLLCLLTICVGRRTLLIMHCLSNINVKMRKGDPKPTRFLKVNSYDRTMGFVPKRIIHIIERNDPLLDDYSHTAGWSKLE